MPDRLPFTTCDVFTDRPFSGNPLAIVEEADALNEAAMQRIAREFNLSETIFVRRPADPDNTASVRIFFPTGEIPFAGHPTIGCAIHLATARAPEGDFDTVITLEEVAGLVPVTVMRRNGMVWAELQAPVVPHGVGDGNVPDAGNAAAALGLDPGQIGFGRHAPGLWQGGPVYAYVPVSDRTALTKAAPAGAGWEAFCEATGTHAAYLYTPGSDADYSARMFAPAGGVPEDPATGSASAILAAQLLDAGALFEGETRIALEQGIDMGRPSRIGLRVRVEHGALKAVHVSGGAVPVSQGRIRIPDE